MIYKALLTDLDDTLITSGLVYDKSLRHASDFLSAKYNLDKEKFYKLASSKYTIVAQNFPTVHTRHSRILLFRMALDEVVGKYDLGLLPEVEDIYWNHFLKHVKLFPEVKSTFEKLREKGIKIAIVSDGDLSMRIQKVKAVGLLNYVDEIVASEEVIFEKPFSAIFTLALSKLKAEPHHTIMVGNDYKHDVRGAQLLGIRGGIFAPNKDANVLKNHEVKPDFVIHRFSELLAQFKE